MPGNLWLPLAQYFDKVADTNLLVPHQIEQAEASFISQGLKEEFHLELR